MFSSRSTKPNGTEPAKKPGEPHLSLIAPGTVIDGHLHSEGDIRVEGRVIGTLHCRARLVVGPQGRIDGTVDTLNATIAGQVHGTVLVREVLQVQETGQIVGDIVTEKLVIQAGGVFTGNCKMGSEASEILKRTPRPVLPGTPAERDKPKVLESAKV